MDWIDDCCDICANSSLQSLGYSLQELGLEPLSHSLSHDPRESFLSLFEAELSLERQAIIDNIARFYDSEDLSDPIRKEFPGITKASDLTHPMTAFSRPCLAWLYALSAICNKRIIVVCGAVPFRGVHRGQGLFSVQSSTGSRQYSDSIIVGIGGLWTWHEISRPGPDHEVWQMDLECDTQYLVQYKPTLVINRQRIVEQREEESNDHIDDDNESVRSSVDHVTDFREQNFEHFDHITLAEFLSDETKFSFADDFNPTPKQGLYHQSKRLSLAKTHNEFLTSLHRDGSLINLSMTVDIDAIVGTMTLDSMPFAFKTDVTFTTTSVAADKDLETLKKVLVDNNMEAPDYLKMVRIGIVKELFAHNAQLFFYYSSTLENSADLVAEAVNKALTLPCHKDREHRDNCHSFPLVLQNLANRAATRSRKRKATDGDLVNNSILSCFVYHFKKELHNIALLGVAKSNIQGFYYKCIDSKGSLICADLSNVDSIFSRITDLINTEYFTALSLDICFQFIPQCTNESTLKDLIFSVKVKQYKSFLTSSIANAHCNDNLGIFQKINFYHGFIDLIKDHNGKVVQYRKAAETLMEVCARDRLTMTTSIASLKAALIEDSADLRSRLMAAAKISSGVRAEVRVSYDNLSPAMTLLAAALTPSRVGESLFLLPAYEMTRFIFASQVFLFHIMMKNLKHAFDAALDNEPVMLAKSLATINAIESLRAVTYWSGRTFTYAGQLLWTCPDEDCLIEKGIESFNFPNFHGSTYWDEYDHCFSFGTGSIAETIIGNISKDSKKYLKESLDLASTMRSERVDSKGKAKAILRSYEDTVLSYVSQSTSAPGGQLTRDILERNGCSFMTAPIDLYEAVDLIFNGKRINQSAWNRPFIIGVNAWAEKASHEEVRRALIKYFDLDYVHYAGDTTFFRTSKYFYVVKSSEKGHIGHGNRMAQLQPETSMFGSMLNWRTDDAIVSTSNVPARRQRTRYSDVESMDLVKGVNKHGLEWQLIAGDPSLCFFNGIPRRTNVNLKDRWRTMLRMGMLSQSEGRWELRFLEGRDHRGVTELRRPEEPGTSMANAPGMSSQMPGNVNQNNSELQEQCNRSPGANGVSENLQQEELPPTATGNISNDTGNARSEDDQKQLRERLDEDDKGKEVVRNEPRTLTNDAAQSTVLNTARATVTTPTLTSVVRGCIAAQFSDDVIGIIAGLKQTGSFNSANLRLNRFKKREKPPLDSWNRLLHRLTEIGYLTRKGVDKYSRTKVTISLE